MLPPLLINQIVPSPIYRNTMCLSPLAICHHIFQTSLPPPPLTQSYHIKNIRFFRDLYNFIKFSEPSKNKVLVYQNDSVIEFPTHIHDS